MGPAGRRIREEFRLMGETQVRLTGRRYRETLGAALPVCAKHAAIRRKRNLNKNMPTKEELDAYNAVLQHSGMSDLMTK